MKIFDFLFSNLKWYRNLGGSWKRVCIIIDEPGRIFPLEIKKWVREGTIIHERHWRIDTFEKDLKELTMAKQVAEYLFKRELTFSELSSLYKFYKEAKGSVYSKILSAVSDLDESINHRSEKIIQSREKLNRIFLDLEQTINDWRPNGVSAK